MGSSAPIWVALIDDDQRIHTLITELLRNRDDIALVGQGLRGEDAISVCRVGRPDIVLMDVVMPGIEDAAATQSLLEAFPSIKVLALSSYQEYEHILAMLNSGATSYLVKDALFDDLLDTILMTHQGNTVLSPSVKKTLLSPIPVQKDTFHLTDRELDVVRLMGQGLTNRQIAVELEISSSTVSFHLNNILSKMDLQTRSEILIIAAKHGLI